jgi:hypothetical protein
MLSPYTPRDPELVRSPLPALCHPMFQKLRSAVHRVSPYAPDAGKLKHGKLLVPYYDGENRSLAQNAWN